VVSDVAKVDNGHDAEDEGEVDRAGDRDHDEHLVGAVAHLRAAPAGPRGVVMGAVAAVVVAVPGRRRRQPPIARVVWPRAAPAAPGSLQSLQVKLLGRLLQLGRV